MKKQLLKLAEKTLIDRKSELLSKAHKELEIDTDGDDTDLIQGKIIANITSQINNRERNRLEKIEKALLKIKDGKFGICDDCEEMIADKRLEANPEFSVCISCAEQKEIDAKLMRTRGGY